MMPCSRAAAFRSCRRIGQRGRGQQQSPEWTGQHLNVHVIVPLLVEVGPVRGDPVELHKAGVPRQTFAAPWLSRSKLLLSVGTSTTFGLGCMGRATFKLGQWC